MSKRHSHDGDSYRTVVKIVRFSPLEAANLEELARAAGRSLSALVREILFERVPRTRRRAESDPILAELARIGRDLNDLKHAIQSAPGSSGTGDNSTESTRESAPVVERLQAALTAYEAAIRSVVTRRKDAGPATRKSTKRDKPAHIETAIERGRTSRESGTTRIAAKAAQAHRADPAQGVLW